MASWRYRLGIVALGAVLFLVFARGAVAGPALRSLGISLPPGPMEKSLEELASRGLRQEMPRTDLAELMLTFYQYRLPPPAHLPIFQIIEEAGKKEVPIWPLMLKIREGLAKGAPPERVVEACHRRLNALGEGRDILMILRTRGAVANHMPVRAYLALASYLEAGLSPQGLAELARAPEVDSIHNLMHGATALWRLDMVGLGHAQGVPLVRAAIKEDLRPFGMRVMVQEVSKRLRGGAPPERAAKEVMEELPRIREFCMERMGGGQMHMHMRMQRMRQP